MTSRRLSVDELLVHARAEGWLEPKGPHVTDHRAIPVAQCPIYRPPPRVWEMERCQHLWDDRLAAWIVGGQVPVEELVMFDQPTVCVVVTETDPIEWDVWSMRARTSERHHHMCARCYRRAFGSE